MTEPAESPQDVTGAQPPDQTPLEPQRPSQGAAEATEADPYMDRIERGSDAGYCSHWPKDGHATKLLKPARSPVFLRQCQGCDWIDGEELAADIAGLRQPLLDRIAELECTLEQERKSHQQDAARAYDEAARRWVKSRRKRERLRSARDHLAVRLEDLGRIDHLELGHGGYWSTCRDAECATTYGVLAKWAGRP